MTDILLHAPSVPGTVFERVLTGEALAFVADLARTHGGRVADLLARRRDRQAAFDAGERPRFLPETAGIRERDWTVAPLPRDLLDRRVEITGPVDRKMIINALNSGASVFMADFEDSCSPTWANLIEGQANLQDAVAGTIGYVAPDTGKTYRLADRVATLFVRPRGWHLFETHATLAGRPIPAGLFDFGLYFFHNALALLEKGSGPYLYLPKMESHTEARLWNEVFAHAEERLGIPRGTTKATVLVETLPAAFEMDEILWELRERSAGLNCGRWDYMFSFIKTHRADPRALMPDRAQVTMTQPFLRAYTQLAIKTCHRRGVHAIGGMAAQIPIKNDPVANEEALERVRADKLREVTDGHDGTWVAHPGLVPIARAIFDAHMPAANQIDSRTRFDFTATAEDLLGIPEGTRTEAGLRHNVRVGVQYLEAWLRGMGCVPLYDLMEDAATAEICRTQVWQWLRHGARLLDAEGVEQPLTIDRFRQVVTEELDRLGDPARFEEARRIFDALSTAPTLSDFLTIPAYEALVAHES